MFPEHFARFIAIGSDGECWLWIGGKDSDGYGLYRAPGSKIKVRAHRHAFALWHGQEPVLWVCHTCDVRACVNPHHLVACDPRWNYDDMAQKGRRPFIRTNAKLDENLVREIRQRYAAGEGGYIRLARDYGVSAGCIQQVVTGRTWRSVPR